MASSHHDQSQRSENDHGQEALSTTKCIHGPGHGNEGCSRHTVTDDINGVQQGMGGEVAGHIGDHSPKDRRLEGIDEV